MAAVMVLVCLVGYALGYRFYSSYLSRKVFLLNPDTPTPAHTLRDGIDYLPTNRFVLFGHHYASITGLSPMLGPAVAVIWGWVPAMIWVVCGAVLIGCVHDFSALVVSLRARGKSIGKVAEGIIGKRARSLFHGIIFFGIALAMGVFVYVIAELFAIDEGWSPEDPSADLTSFPTAVLPSAGLMLLAMAMGWLLYRKQFPLAPTALAGFVLLLVLVALGLRWPFLGLDRMNWPGRDGWTWILLGYGLTASILPVWFLLQPRDFLNSLLLYLGLGSMYLGLFIWRPDFAAPHFQAHPEGAPPILPFVFIVIACGSVSGFHSLVSSGTTSKQLDREPDARMIGYGGMVGESLLGLIAVVACTAGFVGTEANAAELWADHYRSWTAVQALGAKLGGFITGGARFIEHIGILDFRGATALVAVVVVSFALTTLDSATRLLRYNISEIGETIGLPLLQNRYVSSVLGVCAIGFFAFYEIGGQPAGLALWQLFGTINQLLAGLALLTVTLYLQQRGKNFWVTAIPMVFMLVNTLTAMVRNLQSFFDRWDEGGAILFLIGLILFGLAIWLVLEALIHFTRNRGRETIPTMAVFPEEEPLPTSSSS